MSLTIEDQLYENGLLIITGSTPQAEEFDRPLAYKLKKTIEDILMEKGLKSKILVIGDLWYLNAELLQKLPMISIGGPGVNAVSAHLYAKLQNYLAIDDTLLIQMDPLLKDLRVSIWGTHEEATQSAVELFVNKKCLHRFISAACTRYA